MAIEVKRILSERVNRQFESLVLTAKQLVCLAFFQEKDQEPFLIKARQETKRVVEYMQTHAERNGLFFMQRELCFNSVYEAGWSKQVEVWRFKENLCAAEYPQSYIRATEDTSHLFREHCFLTALYLTLSIWVIQWNREQKKSESLTQITWERGKVPILESMNTKMGLMENLDETIDNYLETDPIEIRELYHTAVVLAHWAYYDWRCFVSTCRCHPKEVVYHRAVMIEAASIAKRILKKVEAIQKKVADRIT